MNTSCETAEQRPRHTWTREQTQTKGRGRYQIVPDIQGERWELFKANIEKYVLENAIVKDEGEIILDGHQRYRACIATGTELRHVIQKGLSENQKWDYVLSPSPQVARPSGSVLPLPAVALEQLHLPLERLCTMQPKGQVHDLREADVTPQRAGSQQSELGEVGQRGPTQVEDAGLARTIVAEALGLI